MTAPLVFLDLETTGVDPALHEVWEVAFAVNDGPIRSGFVAHSTASADPYALRFNHYRDRFRGEPLLGDRPGGGTPARARRRDGRRG